MVNPQLENGYIRIATEVWEALGCYRLSGEEWLVLNCIIRKTYGWNKKEDKISLQQIADYTHLNRPNVARTIKKLVSKSVIKKDNSYINSYCFNKKYQDWEVLSKKITASKSVIKSDNRVLSKKITKVLSKKIHTIDNIDTNTKDNINSVISLFEKINPAYKRFYANKTERQSLQNLIKLYGKDWIVSLIEKLPEINRMPYAPKITSPYELEMKLAKLKIFLEQEKNKSSQAKTTEIRI